MNTATFLTSITLSMGLAFGAVYFAAKPARNVSSESAALHEVRKTNPGATLGQGRLVDLDNGRHAYTVEIR